MSFNTASAVASEISSVDFGFLSAEEILRLSVKEINCPDTFNHGLAGENPVPNDGGLYDQALGADRDLHQQCATCRLDWRHCPGHMGHIQLPIPLYHPIFFDSILRLIRSTCQYCWKLRIPKVKLNYYQCQLRLIHHGLLAELGQLANMKVVNKTQKRYDDSEAEEGEEESEDDQEDAVEDLMEKRVKFVKQAIKANRVSKMDWAQGKVEAISEARREVIKELLKELPAGNKCFHCKGAAYQYKSEAYNKVFEKPLPEKAMNEMRQQGKIRKLALAITEKKSEQEAQEEEDEDAMDVDEAASEEESGTIVQSAGKEPAKTDRFVTQQEVYAILKLMFENEQDAMTMIFQPSMANLRSKKRKPISCDMFFISVLPVPPTNFRPPAVAGKDMRENAANTMYRKVLQTIEQIKKCHMKRQDPDTPPETLVDLLRYQMNLTVQLQEAVNTLIDSTKNSTKGAAAKSIEDGIKQKLEKKEGLFRKNMMGKRVNFAARSVISPDPNIETSEIGVPLVFAQKLTYPEPVTDHNFERLRNAVINGPDKYPGASQVEMENGSIIDLGRKTLKERTAIAKQLNTASMNVLSGRNKKVHRHLRDGDYVLMNRQPTLHKPSIMGHRAKVLPKEKTIRMHYANCNTYNADFDGDEMNMHLPQNDIARAEAQEIASTDWQYLVGTSGKPLRGLIQDHLVMGLWMTNRDTFFTREQYQQLLYSCLRPEDPDNLTNGRIITIPPAFQKPRKLWTGKQVISTIMKNITPQHLPGLFLKSRAKIRGGSWGSNDNEEGDVIFHGGELVCGILDKNQFGPSEYGFVHSVYEVFGPTTAGKLLSVLGRLFTKFLHMRAFTCGMDDLLLTPEGNAARKEKLSGASRVGKEVATKYVGLDAKTFSEKELKVRLENVMREDKQGGLDLLTNSRTKDFTSDVIATCLPSGLVKPFPKNHMQAMTLSGAKGSDVNSSQISCLLGQQTLEGKRVPVMVSGKTLPCFRPFETNVRAGGYIADRFLTGIRPQEYYFHCMAGREGLIDTAVKTSRSGYLQRCLIKGMEGLKVEYDNTVRDSDGSLIQFLYGEDSLDVIKQKHLTDFKFLVENAFSILPRLGYTTGDGESDKALQKILSNETAKEYIKSTVKKVKKHGQTDTTPDPAMAVYSPSAFVGSVSEKFYDAIQNYVKTNPHGLLGKPKKKGPSKAMISKDEFIDFMYLKYLRSLVDPGEAVGIVAGQSIGEPSTQMTLNTFHLAGHATKNVTLGIPRLREIVMTASASISTPSMMLTIVPDKTEEEAEWFRKRITRTSLSEVVDFVTVTEKIRDTDWGKVKEYTIRFSFFPCEEYEEEYGIKKAEVLNTLKEQFLEKLTKAVKNELKKKAKAEESDIAEGKAVNTAPAASTSRGGDDDDEDDDSDADEEDTAGAKQKSRQSQAISYEEPDDEEAEIQANADPDENENFQDEGITDMSGNEADSRKSRKAIAKAREDAILEAHRDVRKFQFDDKKGEWCEIALEFSDPSKILMISIVENVCRQTVIRQLPGIKTVTRVGEGELSRADLAAGKRKLATEGVNFQQIWEWCGSYVEPNDIYSNDIAAFLKYYGVEAARAVIVAEMQAVFGGHGISVDSRHLTLIADMMTRAGTYIPFNRIGMASSISPFMKMSFETTCNFLKDATMYGERDRLENPSSRIVMGKLSGVGTGSFDLLMDLKQSIKEEVEEEAQKLAQSTVVDEDVKMED